MYAIVKTGGKQYKVAEGDVITVEKLDAADGAEVALTPILLVDGATVTHDAAALANAGVTAEVVGQTRGPKIHIHKFKNKTGYHKRQGHRQQLTQVRVTGITSGKPKAVRKSTAKSTAKSAAVSTEKAAADTTSAPDSPETSAENSE